MSCYRLVIILATVLCAEVLAISHEVRPERFEQMLGFEYVNTTGIRVRKFNRTTWIFDGQGEAFQDFNDDYMFTITMAHSRLGNNQWNEYPMKIARSGACEILNGPYKEYQHHFVEYTNLPRVGEERVCPFRKGLYWVKEFAPGTDWVLPVVPEGYWRFTGDVYDKEGQLIIRLAGYFHLSRNMFE